MTLPTGTRLGPYEILSPLGAGGMGEVYRAKDTRLDRTVAVKVLPSHLSENAELRQRFEREPKTISALYHPHIRALHDVGNQNGTDFLVMEYQGSSRGKPQTPGPTSLPWVLSLTRWRRAERPAAHYAGSELDRGAKKLRLLPAARLFGLRNLVIWPLE